MPIRFLTGGESHGPALVGIIEGLPAGLALAEQDINADLRRRQGGYGRGGRMKIESDAVRFLSGIRWGRTLGSPLTLMIENRDFANWSEGMSHLAEHEGSIAPVTRPRPGHADLTGALKYGHGDVRNVLERSSARETAMRVAVGAVCKRMLAGFGVSIGSYVISIGSESIGEAALAGKGLAALHVAAEESELRCPDADATGRMKALIDKAASSGDTLGGVFCVFAEGAPVGLGSHVHMDRRLDGRLAGALMGIQAIKGVEVGMGFRAAASFGSDVMDEILPDPYATPPYARSSNNAGGVEGGMTNGMPIVLRAAMKPIPTLRRALRSVDMRTGQQIEAAYERSDVCAVAAASVIGEAMMAITLAEAASEKFGGDSMNEALANMRAYNASLRGRTG